MRPPLIAPPLSSRIIVAPPTGELVERPLREALIVGRARDNQITIVDNTVARRHARFIPAPDGWLVEDLGSSNGTYVNGERIERSAQLRVGDLVQVGSTRIWFEHTLDKPRSTASRSEAVALLAAIIENPADDDPRLVFADWLGALDEPRGELISCQIMAEHANAAADRAAIRARGDELLSIHELEWAAPLTVPVESWTFRRGFVDRVWTRRVDEAQALRAVHPIDRIERFARFESATSPAPDATRPPRRR